MRVLKRLSLQTSITPCARHDVVVDMLNFSCALIRRVSKRLRTQTSMVPCVSKMVKLLRKLFLATLSKIKNENRNPLVYAGKQSYK